MPATYESATINRAVTALAAIGMAAVAAIAALAFIGTQVPDALASVAGGTVGALATLLTTYMPSPVIGGRRAVDLPVTDPAVAGGSSTAAPVTVTVTPGPAGVAGGGSGAT
jgi:hypothetical protein